MQKNTNGRNGQRTSKVSMIMASFGGIQASVNARKLDFTPHHGTTAAGTDVKSLSSAKIACDQGQIVLRKGNGQIATYKADELEVFAAQHLAGLGYSVTMPNGTPVTA